MGFYCRETLQTSTRCGQAATACPSMMALLVFHSDTTAGSTRLLDLQGDQNIEYDTAVVSLAPSTATERLPSSPPLFSPARKEKKEKEEKKPTKTVRFLASNTPPYVFGEGTLSPLLTIFQLISQMSECSCPPSPPRAHIL